MSGEVEQVAGDEIPLLIDEPPGRPSRLTVVLAHGAGAAMDSEFMNDVARGLAQASLRVVRFEFPYMRKARETGARARPDFPRVLEAAWMRVVAQLGDPTALVIGGKSMGGRIASMIADGAGVRGLVCLGYPFHPAGAPGTLRVSHLKELATPALFLQGERDALGNREEIAGYELASSIRIVYLPDGDHSFKPRKSSGRTYRENLDLAVRETAAFCAGL
jgi:predicted alpha/beta-hydrolase family hydrolase